MSEPSDGPWEPATEHDKLADQQSALGEDPPTATIPSTLAEALRAHAARPHAAQNTLPPPSAERLPAKSVIDDVVLLDMVSRNAPAPHAPSRTETAAGGIVVVATGADGERIRLLCHAAALHIPIVTALGVVHEASSVVVIGEPSPPAPERVVYVARPTLGEDMLLALLRALASGRVVADRLVASAATHPRATELATQLAAQGDRAAIETLAVEAITTLAGADRGALLFHDPVSGALWSEARHRAGGDNRRAAAGVVGWCAQTGHAVVASPAGDDPRYILEIDDPDGKPQSRLLVQPIIGGDRRVHALLVAARRWRRTDFTDAERHVLRDFAALIAPAIDVAAAATPKRASRPTLPGVTVARASNEVIGTATDSASPAQPAKRASTDAGISAPAPSARPSAESSEPRPKRPSASSSEPRPKRPSVESSEPRPKRPSVESSEPRLKRPSLDGSEPRDVVVVATQPDDVARVQKLARKARLEISVLPSAEEVPPYYRIVTLGEAWTSDSDPRVAYAARSAVTDDQLTELLAGLATDRAPAALVATKPSTVAEARRLSPAFPILRALATGTDLAETETTAVAAVRQLLDADRAYCLYFDGEDGSLWSESRERKNRDDRRAIAGIVGWAARTGRAVNIPRASADPRWLGPIDDPDGDPNSQLIAQPVITANRRVIGVLVAVRRPKRPGFSETDVSLLTQLTALMAPLFEHQELAVDTQQLLCDTSVPDEIPVVPSPWQQLTTCAQALPRWTYAAGGAAVMFAIMMATRC